MIDTFRKIDKEYILSDSSVNEYGFRLLTSGYDVEAFQKNPIGYYMHRREDGVLLKWENLRVENDKVWGTPVINFSNERGEQTYNEALDGFLNAASMGHIVVLEYSTEPAMMLPGQTGPTITRWYNKECSLVDIPGNCNALTRLYDAQENELNLSDFSPQTALKDIVHRDLVSAICDELGLSGADDENSLLDAINGLGLKMARAHKLEEENATLLKNMEALQLRLDEADKIQKQKEVCDLLDKALEDRKLTKELKEKLQTDYAGNPFGLSALLSAMPAYRSIAESLRNSRREKAELQWSWDDFEEKDPTGKLLKELKLQHPERYKEIFKEKFETSISN